MIVDRKEAVREWQVSVQAEQTPSSQLHDFGVVRLSGTNLDRAFLAWTNGQSGYKNFVILQAWERIR